MCRGNMQNTSLEFMVLWNEKLNCIDNSDLEGVDGGYCKGEKRNLRSKKKKKNQRFLLMLREECLAYDTVVSTIMLSKQVSLT